MVQFLRWPWPFLCAMDQSQGSTQAQHVLNHCVTPVHEFFPFRNRTHQRTGFLNVLFPQEMVSKTLNHYTPQPPMSQVLQEWKPAESLREQHGIRTQAENWHGFRFWVPYVSCCARSFSLTILKGNKCCYFTEKNTNAQINPTAFQNPTGK